MSKERLKELVVQFGGQTAFCDSVNPEIERLWAENGWPVENRPPPISQKVVWSWLNRRAGPVPPGDYVRPIVFAAIKQGFKTAAADLRPELYGDVCQNDQNAA